MRANRLLPLALAGLLLGAGPAPAASPLEHIPEGPQVYLELADLGALVRDLSSADGRLATWKASEGGQQFLRGKIPLKLQSRLQEWTDGAFGKQSLGRVARALAQGRGALAVYDIATLRFLIVVEDPRGARGMALVGLAQEAPRKEALGGTTVEVLGAGGQSLYLHRGGGVLRLASHPTPLERSLEATVPRLAASADFARQAGDLPAELLRTYLAPEVFSTVYMRNYWAGPGAPPARAVGAALTRFEGGYREVRRREAEVGAPAPGVRALARFLPAWTFREVAGGAPPEGMLDLLLPATETEAGRRARERLAERVAAWWEAAEGWGAAGGLVAADPGAFALGERPTDGFARTWPPAGDLHHRSRAVLAVAFPAGKRPDPAAVQRELEAARRADLGLAGRDGIPAELADGAVQVAAEGDVLLLAHGPGALSAARAGQGRELGEDRPDLLGAFAIDAAALRREAEAMVGASAARSGWLARRRGELVDDFLAGPLRGSLRDLRRVAGLRLARAGGGAEEQISYELRP